MSLSWANSIQVTQDLKELNKKYFFSGTLKGEMYRNNSYILEHLKANL
jgi:hypothetical protein